MAGFFDIFKWNKAESLTTPVKDGTRHPAEDEIPINKEPGSGSNTPHIVPPVDDPSDESDQESVEECPVWRRGRNKHSNCKTKSGSLFDSKVISPKLKAQGNIKRKVSKTAKIGDDIASPIYRTKEDLANDKKQLKDMIGNESESDDSDRFSMESERDNLEEQRNARSRGFSTKR